jgi:hypothetical protein
MGVVSGLDWCVVVVSVDGGQSVGARARRYEWRAWSYEGSEAS